MRLRLAEKLAALPRLLRAYSGGKTAASPDGARASALPLLAALFLCGIFAGGCFCYAFETALMSAALKSDEKTALAAARRTPSPANAVRMEGAGAFTVANPFGADVRPAKEDKRGGAAKPSPDTLKSMTLRGTLPGTGAWIETGGKTYFVLKGQNAGGFTLSDIKYSEARLSDGTGEYTLYLILSGGERPDKADKRRARRANTQRRTQRRAPEKPALDFSGVEPASDGREGAVPRELVDALLMNPYDELAKVRMTPMPDLSGMRIERLDSGSILSRVGVAQGDVISAVNGVNITNVADATNALNSLISGSRFDVTVLRGGKPMELRYQVK